MAGIAAMSVLVPFHADMKGRIKEEFRKYLRRPDIYCVISGTSGIYVFSDRYSGRDESGSATYGWQAVFNSGVQCPLP